MRTLVIVPGWGGSHETWAEFIALASQHYTVHCIDLPCFGDTPCPDTAWGVEDYGEYVQQKIATIAATHGKVFLLGHSFGGQVSTYVAAHYPEHIERLILVAPAIIRTKNRVRRTVFRYLAKSGQWIFRLPLIERKELAIKKLFYHAIGASDYVEAGGIKRDIFKKIIRQDMRHVLPSIQIPTLVVWGTHDAYTPLREGKIVRNLLPDVKLVILKNGTHGLHLYRRADLYEAVRSFLMDVHE